MVTYNAKMKRILNPPSPRPPVTTATSIPPPPKNQGTIQSNHSSLGRIVAEGFAFGTGSAVARQIVNNSFGANTIPSNSTSDEDDKKDHCKKIHTILETCMAGPSNSDCSRLFEDYIRNCIPK